MNILIAYGTSEGQTRKIAEAVAHQIEQMGHQAVLYDTAGKPEGLKPEQFDRIVVAGSVHERGHQQSVEVFVLANKAALQDRPTLFLSVSLSAAFADGQAEARSYIDRFVEGTGWKPGHSQPVAGATHTGEYDYFQTQILEHGVLKDRAETGGDAEFTDWQALSDVIDAFVNN